MEVKSINIGFYSKYETGRVGYLFLTPSVACIRIQFIPYSERSSICTIFKGVLKQKPPNPNIYISGKEERQNKGRDSAKPQLIHKFQSGLKAKYIQFPRHCTNSSRVQGYPRSLLVNCYSRCYSKGNTEIPTTPRGKCLCPFFPLFNHARNQFYSPRGSAEPPKGRDYLYT